MSVLSRRLPAVLLFAAAVSCGAQTESPAENPAGEAPQAKENPVANPVVVIQTSMGEIQAELFADQAPETVKNFLQYVDDKFYDGTIFHRVIDGFMIQGGGFTKNFAQKPTRVPIKNEAANGLKNDRGTLAMARTSDPNSATAQFFINVVDNDGLNRPSPDGYGYAVFGKVISGMDVVDKIKSVETGNKGMFQNVPVKPIEIISIKRK